MLKSRNDTIAFGGSPLVAVNEHETIAWGATAPRSESIVSNYGGFTLNSLDEVIEYENTGGTRFGRCYHLKDSLTQVPGVYVQHYDIVTNDNSYKRSYRFDGDRTVTRAIVACKGGIYDSSFPNVMLDYLPDLAWDSYDWDAFSGRAYRAMEPSLENNFSILNFFYELKDFKELHRSIGSFWRLSRRMKPKTFLERTNSQQGGSATIRGLLDAWTTRDSSALQRARGVAGAHLSWEFAIRPFVSDLSQISKILASMMQRIKEYRDKAGIPQTRHYVEKEDAPDFGDINVALNAYQRIKIKRLNTPQVERHATMRYVYSIPYMSEVMSNILGVMGQLGLSPSRPSIVWNAIPFTFLVDWFFDVGDLLDRWFGRDLNPASVTVLDFCCSQKLKTELTAEWDIDEYYRITGHNQPCLRMVREYYQRERMVPTISTPFTLAPSSGRKVALAASLLLAVSGKRKR